MCMNLNVYQLRTSQYSYESIYMEPSSVHPLISVLLFVIPWTTACQASLSVTNSRSLLKLMSIESVMPSNHLILCLLLLLLPSIFPSIRVFSNDMQSTSCEMLDWIRHKLESRLRGEISITSDMLMTPPLWQKVKMN